MPHLLLLLAFTAAQQPAADEYRVSADVNLAVLSVSVKDNKGNFVQGLDKQDFHVLENGEPQQLRVFSAEDRPVTVGLLVDNSSSMRGRQAEVATAALGFVRSSNPQDEVFVINFNENVNLGLPPEKPFTSDLNLLHSALTSTPPTGRTALCDAVAAGLEHLNAGKHEKKALVVVSDGGDNASRHKCDEVLETARASKVIIYTIGVYHEHDQDRNPGFLKRLARTTGGEAFLPASFEQVAPVCHQIAADLRNQYTVGYVPTNTTQDGTYRRIRVSVNRPGRGHLRVRTREGYVAGVKQ